VATTTPINQFQIPQLADSPNIETAIQPFANAIDQFVVPRFTTVAVRDTRITSPTDGMVCYVTGTGEMYRYNGTGWVSAVPRVRCKLGTQNFSGTTLAGDADLILSVEAGSRYKARYGIYYGATSANDLKINVLGPPSSTVQAGWLILTSGATTNFDVLEGLTPNIQSTSIVAGGISGNVHYGFLDVYAITTSNSGVVNPYFAQYVSGGTTQVFGGSWVDMWKVG